LVSGNVGRPGPFDADANIASASMKKREAAREGVTVPPVA
jgi:hypothetical protein